MAEIAITDRYNEAPSWERCVHHTAPERPYTIDEAHNVMRQYVACLRHECARKHAAWTVLVEAGRIVPDAGRAR